MQQDQARAEQLLLEVLERDADRSSAHFLMGLLRRDEYRLADSRTELETAITLDRNNAAAFLQLGLVSMFLGQPKAGIPNIEKAIRLNPHDPNISAFYWGLGACHLFLDHVDEAVDLLRKARAANPRLYWIGLRVRSALEEILTRRGPFWLTASN